MVQGQVESGSESAPFNPSVDDPKEPTISSKEASWRSRELVFCRRSVADDDRSCEHRFRRLNRNLEFSKEGEGFDYYQVHTRLDHCLDLNC